MLAQNFKTATDLGIEDVELEALIKVLGMLERGEIKAPPPKANFGSTPNPNIAPTMFCMSFIKAGGECGTAACILGWAQIVADNDDIFEVTKGPCEALFYPYDEAIRCRNPAQAAIALRNFLTFGEPRWHEALAGQPND